MLITDSSTPLLRHLGKVVSQYGDSHISVVSRYRGGGSEAKCVRNGVQAELIVNVAGVENLKRA